MMKKIISIVLCFLFLGNIAISQIINSGFENWHSITNSNNAEDPDHWTSTNVVFPNENKLGISKSTDAYSGNYALKISPRTSSFINQSLISVINYGANPNSPFFTGDEFLISDTISFMPTKLTGYYKRVKTNYSTLDTAYIHITLFRATNILNFNGRGELGFKPNNTYQYFEVTILSDPVIPDSVFMVTIYKSQDTSTTQSGYLLLDDLAFEKPVSTNEQENILVKIYPNPVSDVLFLEQPYQGYIKQMIIYDTGGKVVKNIAMPMENINVSDLPTGQYYLKIMTEIGVGVERLIISR